MSAFTIELVGVISAVAPDAPVQSIVDAITLRFGGQLFYIPKPSLRQRNKEIKGKFQNGVSANELCREYNLSNKQIRIVTRDQSPKQSLK